MSFTPQTPSVLPADGGTVYDSGPGNLSVTPPVGMQLGDFVCFWVTRRTTDDIVMVNDGGQTWATGTLRQAGSSASVKIFTCQFNGTWTNSPSIATISQNVVTSLGMFPIRPTTTGSVVSVDVAELYHNFGTAPTTPFDVTASSVTPIASDTIQLFFFFSLDKNQWALQTSGIANLGGAQYRNVDTSGGGRNTSFSIGYKVQASATPTGTVTNRQTALGGDPGLWLTYSFKELTTGTVTVTGVSPILLHNGDSGAVITGTSFGASKGAGFVTISPTNSISDPSAITQPTSAWDDTGLMLGTYDLSTFGYFSNLYLFVQNNSGSSNSTGFIVQRQAKAAISYTLDNKSGSAQASLTGLYYDVRAVTPTGTSVASNNNGTTDGSALFTVPTITLTSGGALTAGNDVWLMVATQGATQALSPATFVRVTPVYT